MSAQSDRPDAIVRFLLRVWSGYLDRQGGAVVRGGGYPMLLADDWSPAPDLMVVLDRHRERMGPDGMDGPADVVIEVATRNGDRAERLDRIAGYRKNSVSEVWILEPENQRIRVERRADRLNYQQETVTWGKLLSSVIEGFWVEAEWLWRDRLPDPEAALDQILPR